MGWGCGGVGVFGGKPKQNEEQAQMTLLGREPIRGQVAALGSEDDSSSSARRQFYDDIQEAVCALIHTSSSYI